MTHPLPEGACRWQEATGLAATAPVPRFCKRRQVDKLASGRASSNSGTTRAQQEARSTKGTILPKVMEAIVVLAVERRVARVLHLIGVWLLRQPFRNLAFAPILSCFSPLAPRCMRSSVVGSVWVGSTCLGLDDG